VTFKRPEGASDFWRRAWVSNVHFFSKNFPQDFRISQNRGEGLILQGTRDWTDYAIEADLMLHLGDHGGLAIRAEGQRRYYAALVTRDGQLQIVCRKDEKQTVLASTPLHVEFETRFTMKLSARGGKLSATVGGTTVEADDATFTGGSAGLIIHEGALSATRIHIGAA
jgi:hypothetical protein